MTERSPAVIDRMRQHGSIFGLVTRFGVGGGLATGLYAFLVATLGWLTAWQSMPIHLLAFALALPVSYLLQRNFAFRDRQTYARTFPRFLATATMAFALSTGAIYVGTQLLSWSTVMTFAAAILTVVAANFFALLFWVFAR